eukprot:3962335-Amphidinium_carterae.1
MQRRLPTMRWRETDTRVKALPGRVEVEASSGVSVIAAVAHYAAGTDVQVKALPGRTEVDASGGSG